MPRASRTFISAIVAVLFACHPPTTDDPASGDSGPAPSSVSALEEVAKAEAHHQSIELVAPISADVFGLSLQDQLIGLKRAMAVPQTQEVIDAITVERHTRRVVTGFGVSHDNHVFRDTYLHLAAENLADGSLSRQSVVLIRKYHAGITADWAELSALQPAEAPMALAFGSPVPLDSLVTTTDSLFTAVAEAFSSKVTRTLIDELRATLLAQSTALTVHRVEQTEASSEAHSFTATLGTYRVGQENGDVYGQLTIRDYLDPSRTDEVTLRLR